MSFAPQQINSEQVHIADTVIGCSFQENNCFFLPADYSYQPTEVIGVTIYNQNDFYSVMNCTTY